MEYSERVWEAMRGYLSLRKAATVEVARGSMAPTLQPGDKVMVRERPISALRRGDIVVMASQGLPVVHRLLEVRRDAGQEWLVTKGDARHFADAAWPAACYVGRVEAIETRGKGFDLMGWRWRWCNRLYGALARVECGVLTGLYQRMPGAMSRPGLGLRWLVRAVRAPGWLLAQASLLVSRSDWDGGEWEGYGEGQDRA